MHDKPVDTEEFKGLGPVSAAGSTSGIWWLAGHVVGAPLAAAATLFVKETSPIGKRIQEVKLPGWATKWISPRYAFAAAAAVAGWMIGGVVGGIGGAVAGRNNGKVATDQFHRLQGRIDELKTENKVLENRLAKAHAPIVSAEHADDEPPRRHHSSDHTARASYQEALADEAASTQRHR